MIHRLLPLMALMAFISAPLVVGYAEGTPSAKEAGKETPKEVAKETPKEVAPVKKSSGECIASEEVIADLEAREQKLKEQESALKEREKELAAQSVAIKEELAKLEGKRAESSNLRQKELSAREEQLNKLMETFEGMSPKSAAQVLGGVDDELAVLALGRLTSAKAGKILGNLKPEQSARLSEMMAFGKSMKGGAK